MHVKHAGTYMQMHAHRTPPCSQDRPAQGVLGIKLELDLDQEGGVLNCEDVQA